MVKMKKQKKLPILLSIPAKTCEKALFSSEKTLAFLKCLCYTTIMTVIVSRLPGYIRLNHAGQADNRR